MPIADVFSASDGGGTVIVSDGAKKLVGSIDFTTKSNTSFPSDGDYQITTTAGNLITAKIKNIGNNAGCSIGISGGRLVGNVPSTANSLFGMGGW